MGKRDYEQADLSVKQRGQGPGARVAQRTEHETVYAGEKTTSLQRLLPQQRQHRRGRDQ